ncbi:dihydrolipoyllysine-residue acetyltransferase [Gammaproteobacteria bacterium 42_54_T18]|nr:dihydrolipoyllysine-residue acetyltransferase [Gammaproteobacteria bacterium 42_54_T18]
MTDKEVRIPDLGGAESVDVIEICVKVGDRVQKEDSLIVVESDKATIEIPAPFDGEVSKLTVKDGDSVAEGDLMLMLTVVSADPGVTGTVVSEVAPALEQEANVESNVAAPEVTKTQSIETCIKTILVPDIGGSENVEIIEINIAVGDIVAVEDTTVVLETDKATMEVPCSDAGTVKELLVSVGDKVSEGSELLRLEAVVNVDAGNDAASNVTSDVTNNVANESEAKAEPEVKKQSSAPATNPASTKPTKTVHAGPAVRRLSRELGVDLAQVVATGPRGRILKDDVFGYVKQAMTDKSQAVVAEGSGLPVLPKIDFSKFGEIEEQALSRINKVSASNLHRSWVNIPHVTQFDEADVTELEVFRKSEAGAYKEEGIKLTLLAFMVKACAKALKAFPRFNSSLSQDGETLILKQYCHIGIAVDTPNGLVVPVIRDADKKSILDIAEDMQILSAKARDKKLSLNDMQGGCFSISSLGGIGGTAFTPIVNWPEVAILGLSRSQMKPVYLQNEFVPRLMLPMSLSYDHRVIDGAQAARFTRYLADQISDIRRLLL